MFTANTNRKKVEGAVLSVSCRLNLRTRTTEGQITFHDKKINASGGLNNYKCACPLTDSKTRAAETGRARGRQTNRNPLRLTTRGLNHPEQHPLQRLTRGRFSVSIYSVSCLAPR